MQLKELKPLHDQGFALIWLRPKSKAPIENRWTFGGKKSWDEIQTSFNEHHNVGVRLGAASRLANGKYLAVIDCDVKSKDKKHFQEMRDCLKTLGINEETAPTVISGRGNGSRHIYICSDAPIKPFTFAKSEERVKVYMPSVGPSPREIKELTPAEIDAGTRLRFAWEISIMGEGQQVVLPPSVHPDSGAKYKWEKPFKASALFLLSRGQALELTPERKEIERAEKFAFQITEKTIDNCMVSDKIKRMVKDGEGVTDRSASAFVVTMALVRSGLSTDDVLTILTDRDNYLGSVGYDHRKTKDRFHAARWVFDYTVKKARDEVSAKRLFEEHAEDMNLPDLTPIEAAMQENSIKETCGFPDKTEMGKNKPTLKNVIHAIEMFSGKDSVGLNEFSNRATFLKDTPYGGRKGMELTDDHNVNVKVWCSNAFGFEPSTTLVMEAHISLLQRNRFHPVKEYLTRIKWDGLPRLPYWLECGLGASGDDAYLEAVGVKVLVAAVKRIFEPGCKFDYVMILEGKQGRGKSTALAGLAGPEWFTDSIGAIQDKDVVDHMAGKWIIELGELAAIRKSDQDILKAFLSRQVDRVRLPYGKLSRDFPRQSIFVGSTNASQYFQDETGNRRFWPVKVEQADFEWLKKNRDQLFAEAVFRYQLGEELFLTKEVEDLAVKEQGKRFDIDEWEDAIVDLVHNEIGKSLPEFPTTTEFFKAMGSNAFREPDERDLKRIAKIMRRLGFEKIKIQINKKRAHRWKNIGDVPIKKKHFKR